VCVCVCVGVCVCVCVCVGRGERGVERGIHSCIVSLDDAVVVREPFGRQLVPT
jgi:hypothetical protein